ncbi:TOMM precursor leader peptide-binding protein [Streptacidiphilus cavernicola]|uniref:TOMM leader peptide-binding protein n=1 Tax=Streptacidiphilus cavernicola TaxID=3342716 RepID=A0ABV6VRH5_9ACTN
MTSIGTRGDLLGFKPHLRAEVVPGEAAYLFSSRGVTAVRGTHIEALVPLLDGTRTLARLLEDAAPAVPPSEAGRLVGRLARANLVGYLHPAADPRAHAYWELAGVDGASAESAVAGRPVRLLTAGGVSPVEAVAACASSGLRVTGPDEAHLAELTVVLCDDYLHPELGRIDARHRAEGRPWLLAKPGGVEPWIGPVFRPGAGPCWYCLAHRLREKRRADLPVQRALGLDGPVLRPEASLTAGRAIGLQAAVLMAARWIAGAEGQEDAVCTIDTLSLTTRHHRLLRRPQCSACGDPGLTAARALAPVRPQPRPKAYGADGGERALSPDQVLERYGHLVGPLTGIVDEVRRDPGLPPGINGYVSGRNLAIRAHSLAGLRSGLRNSSGGKGLTAREAEVGALCEAVERYSATRQGDEPVVRDTLRGLGGSALHPDRCQLFAPWQYRERERWNAANSSFHRVPAPFDPARPVEWTPVWSLTAQTHRYLPTSMLYFDSAQGACTDGPWADSNGNAAGSSTEDAIVQGFLELVERDAVAIWWYNRTRHAAVDLDAFDAPWLAELREAYARMRRQVWVLDVSTDLGVPVMVAVSRRTDKPAEDLAFGFGAHFDPRIALSRALTEMGQLLPAVVDARADGTGYRLSDPGLLSWWTGATTANQPYLLPDPALKPRSPGSYDYRRRPDLRDDIVAAESLVAARGMELLVLDQTRPDVGLPVVKVLVPGLRHFWARFALGRLFDVPVALGRLDRPTGRDRLNPVPLFV